MQINYVLRYIHIIYFYITQFITSHIINYVWCKSKLCECIWEIYSTCTAHLCHVTHVRCTMKYYKRPTGLPPKICTKDRHSSIYVRKKFRSWRSIISGYPFEGEARWFIVVINGTNVFSFKNVHCVISQRAATATGGRARCRTRTRTTRAARTRPAGRGTTVAIPWMSLFEWSKHKPGKGTYRLLNFNTTQLKIIKLSEDKMHKTLKIKLR